MEVYRLCKEIYSNTVLDGLGGRFVGGRWHSPGQRIIYCASSEALAVLELRVHVGRFLPQADYTMHVIELPDECIIDVRATSLPRDWNAVPHVAGSQAFGDEWLKAVRSLGLRVPSIHSQTDWNVLINPEHADNNRVRVKNRRPYLFDRRLF